MKARHKLLLPAALIFGGAFAHLANAQTSPPASQAVLVIPCMGCSTLAKLSNGATQYMLATHPADGTVLLMFSNTSSASGYFRVSSYMMCSTPSYPYYYYCSSGGTVQRYVTAITLSDAEAQQLDARLIAKAIGQVKIPGRYGNSASSALAEDISSGLADDHAAPVRFSAFTQQFYVTLNGKDVNVTVGVTTIDVVFPDGSKVTMRLVDPLGTIRWVVVSRVDAAGHTLPEPSSGSAGSGGAATPPPPPNSQPDPAFYCPVAITSHVCIVDTAYTGTDCPTSGTVTIVLRPCGS